MSGRVSDAQLARALSGYARLAAVVLDQPERWLRSGEEPTERVPKGLMRLQAVGTTGGPRSASWLNQKPAQRAQWWVTRLQLVAAPVAALPRLSGPVAGRIPVVQPTLSAAAAGLAVCAVAREYGIKDSHAWVPVLATAIFNRRLPETKVADGEADAAEAGLDQDFDGLVLQP